MTNPLVNLVQTNGQQVFTTSLIVAEAYGKRHGDVLRSLRQRLDSTSAIVQMFNQRNFASVEYLDSKGESRKMYHLTEDGFLELAMSFTGDKAMETRVCFIEAFRAALNAINKNHDDLAVHTDLMFKINIPERWVVEVIQRSQSSVRRSLSMAINRSKGSALEKHYAWRGNERWYSAWFLANAPFAKEDGIVFKNTLTKLAETLGLESEVKQFLLST